MMRVLSLGAGRARPFGYVHRTERPLAVAVLRPEDAGQLTLECEGMCGL